MTIVYWSILTILKNECGSGELLLEPVNWVELQKDIEDVLFPKLEFDSWERMFYYFFLRQTLGEGKPNYRFGIDQLAELLPASTDKVRKTVRKMDKKGTIKILERGRDGHTIRVVMPSELVDTSREQAPKEKINPETTDFFLGRKFLANLLERESHRCFYCLKKIYKNTSVLDHVVPVVYGGDNGYTNIVACCHECNSSKRDKSGEEHLRDIYRSGILSKEEFQSRLNALAELKAGKLRPII